MIEDVLSDHETRGAATLRHRLAGSASIAQAAASTTSKDMGIPMRSTRCDWINKGQCTDLDPKRDRSRRVSKPCRRLREAGKPMAKG